MWTSPCTFYSLYDDQQSELDRSASLNSVTLEHILKNCGVLRLKVCCMFVCVRIMKELVAANPESFLNVHVCCRNFFYKLNAISVLHC